MSMKLLAIETSCDETAVAIVTDNKEILANIVYSQIEEHKPYGGVVPELAARAHMARIGELINQAMAEAKVSFEELDAIAATGGPGLIGGVIVGVMVAKGMAFSLNKPFVAVNHLEGHALTVRLTNDIEFPYLLLLVSGGHCQILAVEELSKYKKLGGTIDDALGEAFDKVAKMLGLGYPGGPKVEVAAKSGDKHSFKFPKPLLNKNNCDFSFSGLKTAVKREVDKIELNQQNIADICASFQYTVGEIMYVKVLRAIAQFRELHPKSNKLVVAGGVAANQYLRSKLEELAKTEGFKLVAPPINLCTDNAAMIGWVAVEKFKKHGEDNLDFAPRATWPLAKASLL
jgi:tRNA N6-adenosine threonylcarbamoyltransferase